MISSRLLLVAVVLVNAANAQTRPANPEPGAPLGTTVTLVVGRGELFQYVADIKQVVTAEPKIADVVVISPREVMINAKAAGRTTVIVWDGSAKPVHYDVDVIPDNFEFDEFRTQLRKEFPGSEIQVTGKGETIVLSGTTASSDQTRRAGGLAQSRAKTVVNLLQNPPDPEPRQILLQVKFASIDRTALNSVGFNLFSLNGKMQGGSSTEQFTAPKFNQVQSSNATNSVNFSDLLNLFVYPPRS